MDDSKFWTDVQEEMRYLLLLKVEEFADFDYKQISEEDIVSYLQYKYRRVNHSEIKRYELTSTILNLTPVHLMKYFSIMAMQGKQFV